MIMIQKVRYSHLKQKHADARNYLFKKYFDQEDVRLKTSTRFFFDAFIDIETQITIEDSIRSRIILDLEALKFTQKQYKRLNRLSPYKRRVAVAYLQTLRTQKARNALQKRLYIEKDDSVRFYIIYALKEQLNSEDFEFIMKTLSKSKASYPHWIYAILKNQVEVIKPFLDAYEFDNRIPVKQFMLYLANHIYNDRLKNYAIERFMDPSEIGSIRKEALKALANMYPEELVSDIYLEHTDETIRKMAIRACSTVVTYEMVENLLNHMDGSLMDLERANALSRIVFDSKKLLLDVLEYYPRAKNDFQRMAISRVLSHHFDYIMLKLKSSQYPQVKDILKDILKMHIVEDLIDFVNYNKDLEVEKVLIELIKTYATQDKYLLDEFSIYLNQKILNKMGLIKKPLPTSIREKSPFELDKVLWISFWITLSIAIFPILFFALNFNLILSGAPLLDIFMVEMNRYLSFYFITINSIYLILMLVSIKGSNERLSMWQIKKQTLLFEHDLLPSISIIAPAYNEEKSIIESVTSLLNLKYPKYEVIVVNDGSKDDTIGTLVRHFELERKHPFFPIKLRTKPLRSVYVSKQIPNLIVIDKQNGGKADALNMGINAAKNDYVCGIDADSLLEEDALLKLMSITLDDATNHIAIGGNIVPVNGSDVDRGKIERSGLAKNPLVRLQTLEYLRAFTTGRVGWSKLNSLLIISGAFGLFNRHALLDTGGYLTISGDLKKDTVGEDMELVVRLTHKAIQNKESYRVAYVHNANCYTELPSDLKSLLKQRNRWQRGLLDILSYHRRMLFNPKYRQPGLLGFPYFFIFEMMGPFIELVGYAALLSSLLLGLLNVNLVLLLFYATIGYGIIISLISLWISERQSDFYRFKDIFILIILAIFENFGYRQLMSLHRIRATFAALKENGSWGSQARTGFNKK
ncbi:glycosyltransferase family 2 protein [Acholeplasma vituli]|uniref:Glycosyltransferase family 2 protein n=1 Tax=Paracholeplasma vituli TaxID=69473 RepID=A0ABT2PUZ4_9MOLU|nr:glycosyltransferase family 2 protein [Paracholeplasma vituli]MCU0104774.1 glycosyltransferase family 2 protein [Paracholeplasma vituli]